MALISNMQRAVAVCFASLLLTACGGGGGGGGDGSPAAVTEPSSNTNNTSTKAALNRSNALFLSGSALAIGSASANLYDFFALTQRLEQQAKPVRMAGRVRAALRPAPYLCANGNSVTTEVTGSANAQTTIAHFSECQLTDSLTVSGDISVTQTATGAELTTQDFAVEKHGKRYLYTVHSQQSWNSGTDTTVITGSENVAIKSADNAWTISSSNLNLELTVDNENANTLSQSLSGKIDSSLADSVQLINNRIYGENDTSIKIGGGYIFWDLLAEDDAKVDLELDDNGDYTADFFNTIACSKLLNSDTKTENHAPVVSSREKHFFEKIASTLAVDVSDADSDFISYDWKLLSASHSNYFFDQTHSSHPAFGATEAGDFEFAVTVSDGTSSKEIQFSVQVTPIDPSNLEGIGIAVGDINLAYGENLQAQISLANEDLNGAEIQVLRGPDGFSVSQEGVLSWTNDHLYDGGQINFSFGLLRNGYWEKIWYGHIYPAAP